MAIASFTTQQLISLDGVKYKLDRKISDDSWQLLCLTTGQYITHKTNELLKLYTNGNIKFIFSENQSDKYKKSSTAISSTFTIDELPPKLQKIIKERYVHVKEILNAGLDKYTADTMPPIITKTHNKLETDSKQPSWHTVNRWRKSYLNSGNDIRGLIPKDKSKGNRSPRYSNELLNIMNTAISEIYMKLERGTIKETLYYAINLVSQNNKFKPKSMHMQHPTRRMIKRLIDQIPYMDKVIARRGRQAAAHESRTVLNNLTATRPLERAEIDHTTLDIIVVDNNMLPLGRPTLTICIDTMTRCILGMYIGFEPPNYLTVAQCLKHAFLPKTDIKNKYPSIQNEWDAYGVMETLVVDNGLEFHGKNLESLCHPFGITIQYSPRKMPWKKGIVERFIGTLNRNIAHGNPGTTFSNIFEKEDYNAVNNATIKLDKFREIANKWVADIYHQEIHRTIKQKPSALWKENINNTLILLPSDIDDLNILTNASDTRSLTHKGIELNSITYNSEELSKLRLRYGNNMKVIVRYSQDNLGFIYVNNPKDEQTIRVPALNQDYASGLSEYQHKLCKHYAKTYLNKEDKEALSEAKVCIREIVNNEMQDKKRIKTRKRAYRASTNKDQDNSNQNKLIRNNINNNHITKEKLSAIKFKTKIDKSVPRKLKTLK